jgi:ribosomal RNA-processing protein 9
LIYKISFAAAEFILTMSDPFLSLPGTKRKRPSKTDTRSQRQGGQSRKGAAPRPKRRLRDASPEADDDDEIGAGGIESDIDMDDAEETDESDNDETPAERRLRLAKEYLDKVKSEVGMCRGDEVDFRERF